MEKFIPKEKLSKKKKRELNAAKRNTWGALNPITRKPDNPKAYNRRKAQDRKDDSDSVSFYFQHIKYDTRRVKALGLTFTYISVVILSRFDSGCSWRI